MKVRAAIYARVSTDDQAERGYSLPSQIDACQRFAAQKELEVTGIFQDDISGSTQIRSRPAGRQLQTSISDGIISVVIVYQVDRFSRDIVDMLQTVRDWLRAGVEIYALDIGKITSELDIGLVIKGWQGGDERQKFRERSMRGKTTKARSGKFVGEGITPYGYIRSAGELVVNESEAQIVRMIYDWYVHGNEHGGMMSLIKIAERLTEMGIPTPSESKRVNNKRANYGVWFYATVNWILHTETYCGVLRYGRRVSKGGKIVNRPKEQQIPINVPPIVSRETWELAQERRRYNSKIAKRRTKREYLLRSLLYCGCGRRMAGTNGKYICTRHYNTNGGKCSEPVVAGRLIEKVTWDYIMGLLTDPHHFEQILREAQVKEAVAMEPKQNEIENILAILEETEQEAAEIARAIPKARGLIARKLEQQGDEVERRYQALMTRKAELEASLQSELTEATIQDLLQFRAHVVAGLKNPTFEDKQHWLHVLQTAVTVTNSFAVVSCRLGGKPLQVHLTEINNC